MEDFIYILAGVAYLAYSIYSAGQKKKKKLEQAQQQAYAEAETEVETPEPFVRKEAAPSIFNEILGLQNFDLNVEEELYEEVEEDIIDVIPKEEGVRTTNLQTSIKVQDEYEEENAMQLKEEEALDYEFDLRDAIISSEILNPPYINR